MIKDIDQQFVTGLRRRNTGVYGRSESVYSKQSQYLDFSSYQWEWSISCSGRPYSEVDQVIRFLDERNGFMRPFIFIDPSINQADLAGRDAGNSGSSIFDVHDRGHVSVSQANANNQQFNQDSIPGGSYFSFRNRLFQIARGGFVFDSQNNRWTAPLTTIWPFVPNTGHAFMWSRPEVSVRLTEVFNPNVSDQSEFVSFSIVLRENLIP